jgi:hypothetical protein
VHHHNTPHAAEPRKGERGASLVEYALMLALIATVVFSAVSFFGLGNTPTASAASASSGECCSIR